MWGSRLSHTPGRPGVVGVFAKMGDGLGAGLDVEGARVYLLYLGFPKVASVNDSSFALMLLRSMQLGIISKCSFHG